MIIVLTAYAAISLAIGIASIFIGPQCPWLTWSDRIILVIVVAALWPLLAFAILVLLVC